MIFIFSDDRICIIAACSEIPLLLIEQLRTGGKLITPKIENGIQNLVLLEKEEKGVRRRVICEVLYVFFEGEVRSTGGEKWMKEGF